MPTLNAFLAVWWVTTSLYVLTFGKLYWRWLPNAEAFSKSIKKMEQSNALCDTINWPNLDSFSKAFASDLDSLPLVMLADSAYYHHMDFVDLHSSAGNYYLICRSVPVCIRPFHMANYCWWFCCVAKTVVYQSLWVISSEMIISFQHRVPCHPGRCRLMLATILRAVFVIIKGLIH